jgi:hypothetical protein
VNKENCAEQAWQWDASTTHVEPRNDGLGGSPIFSSMAGGTKEPAPPSHCNQEQTIKMTSTFRPKCLKRKIKSQTTGFGNLGFDSEARKMGDIKALSRLPKKSNSIDLTGTDLHSPELAQSREGGGGPRQARKERASPLVEGDEFSGGSGRFDERKRA